MSFNGGEQNVDNGGGGGQCSPETSAFGSLLQCAQDAMFDGFKEFHSAAVFVGTGSELAADAPKAQPVAEREQNFDFKNFANIGMLLDSTKNKGMRIQFADGIQI